MQIYNKDQTQLKSSSKMEKAGTNFQQKRMKFLSDEWLSHDGTDGWVWVIINHSIVQGTIIWTLTTTKWTALVDFWFFILISIFFCLLPRWLWLHTQAFSWVNRSGLLNQFLLQSPQPDLCHSLLWPLSSHLSEKTRIRWAFKELFFFFFVLFCKVCSNDAIHTICNCSNLHGLGSAFVTVHWHLDNYLLLQTQSRCISFYDKCPRRTPDHDVKETRLTFMV